MPHHDRSRSSRVRAEASARRSPSGSRPTVTISCSPTAIAEFGTVTGLVNNAGITGRISGFLDGTIEESERLFRVNVLAPIVLTRAAIARMATDRGGAGGSIVNISSGAATTGSPNTYIPYAMSKAAINALTAGA